MTEVAYGVSLNLDPQAGPTVTPVDNSPGSPDKDESPTYSPQSPPTSPTSDIQDESVPGYSPIYRPSSPTYTHTDDNHLSEEDVDRIGRVLHEYRTQVEATSLPTDVVDLTQDDEDVFDPDYEDYDSQ